MHRFPWQKETPCPQRIYDPSSSLKQPAGNGMKNMKRLNWTFQEPLSWFIHVYIVSVSIPTSHPTREKTSTSAARIARLWWRNLSTSARSLEISWPWSCAPGGNEHGNCWTLLPFSRATVIDRQHPTSALPNYAFDCFRMVLVHRKFDMDTFLFEVCPLVLWTRVLEFWVPCWIWRSQVTTIVFLA
jgi:hypothetical protein